MLVIDPHPATRAATAAVLEGLGARCLQAAHCEQALELMRVAATVGHPLDAVLLDIRSSTSDGWFTIRRLRGEPGGARGLLPLFALSADDSPYIRQLAELFGATALLSMPCPAGVLCTLLADEIERSRGSRHAVHQALAPPGWVPGASALAGCPAGA